MLKKLSYIIGILSLTVFSAGCNQGAIPGPGNDLERTGVYNDGITNRSGQLDRWNTVGYSPYNANKSSTLGPNQNQQNYQGVETKDHYFGKNNGTNNRRNVIYNNERILNEPIPTPQESQAGNRYGLVHVTRSDLDQLSGAPFNINRNALANIVAQSISSLPGVENASILVTDDHVYIGYNGNADATKKIKQAADSVVPGYYRVHVSSDRNLTDKVLSLTNGTTRDIDQELDGILGATRNRPLTPGSNPAEMNPGRTR